MKTPEAYPNISLEVAVLHNGCIDGSKNFFVRAEISLDNQNQVPSVPIPNNCSLASGDYELELPASLKMQGSLCLQTAQWWVESLDRACTYLSGVGRMQIVVLDPLGPSSEAGSTFTDKGTPRRVALVRWKSLYFVYC